MLSANSAISLVLASSIAKPRNCHPGGPYRFSKSQNQGISILHGPHQVAQKFRTTGLPRKSDRRTVLPSRDCRVKSGAMPFIWALPVAIPGEEWRAILKPNTSIRATTRATTTKTTGSRLTKTLQSQRESIQKRQVIRNDGKAS